MKIEHTRGVVTLTRNHPAPNTQWVIVVEGQTSTVVQELIINSPQALADLKLLIGQVEHAAKVLGEEGL